MKKLDYIILGAGISGLSFGRLLQIYAPEKTFIILEKESTPGGLCRSVEMNGNHFDIGGGHFLYSKHEKVYDFIFSHIPESEFNKFNRVTKIKLGDNLIDYPIEENLWQLPEAEQIKCVNSIIDSLEDSHGEGFQEWIYKNLGKEIANNYLIPYNIKMWGVNLDDLSTDWLYKIPKVDLKEILKSIILRKSNKENVPSHDYFYYPKEGGFGRISDSIYEKVKEHILLNESLHYLDTEKNEVNFRYSGKIINTLSWEVVLSSIEGIPPRDIVDLVLSLRNTSLEVSFEKKSNVFNSHIINWTYIPDLKEAHHREYNVSTYAVKNKDRYICKETNLLRAKYSPISFINRYAYPIPLKGKNEAIEQILAYFEERNIYGLGRWGTHEHHNSDVCILKSMELFTKLEGKAI